MNRVDELLWRLASPAPLRPEQIVRIRAAIDDEWRPRPMPRVAIAGAMWLALCGFATAAVYGITQVRRSDVAPTTAAPPEPAPPITPNRDARSHEIALPPAPPVMAPAMTPSPQPSMPARVHTPARTKPPRSEPPPPTSEASSDPIVRGPTAITAPAPATTPIAAEPSDDALAAESLLIASSLRRLRKDRAPTAALAILDRHDVEFPHGVLADEARATRVEALMSLGDRRGALALLDAMTVGTELGVVRGELRLAVGRLDEASTDFTAALIGARDDLEARALFGRAACRSRLGDRAGARRDLANYLERFPRGQQATAARAALAEIDR